jgi:hypothetical protein
MDCAKCRWKADLQFHVVLRWVGENREASFEYAENTLSKLRLRASQPGKYTFASLDDVKWLQERLELEPIFEEDTYHTL